MYFVENICTAAYLLEHNTVLCIKNVQEISSGSAGDSKTGGHDGMCLGLKGIYSFPVENKRNGEFFGVFFL